MKTNEQPAPCLPVKLAETPFDIEPVGTWPKAPHHFHSNDIWAINAALATGRPLLVRGEPGTGKSQLARAAAQKLGWPFMSTVVNARFEPEDLLYRFDAVARLSLAQVMPGGDFKEAIKELDPSKFLLPEILWWAIDFGGAGRQYESAKKHCGMAACNYGEKVAHLKNDDNGVVVLIDEIDKADTELPNSLLEALANGGFQTPYGGKTVTLGKGRPPLVIITTNEERELPAAFLRRCLVHQMDLPSDRDDLKEHLLDRAKVHYPSEKELSNHIREKAINMLIDDREKLKEQDLPYPGQAELLDLLAAVRSLGKSKEEQLDALRELKQFALCKNRL